MISSKKTSANVNPIGEKTARACDACIRKRARWYCAADDAFLCQGCDSSVHSANQLASRHQRVRLGTSSPPYNNEVDASSPAWLQGFTRKARTPRHSKSILMKQPKEEKISNTFPLVPEIGGEEASTEENEEQLLYQVPIYDPFDISNEVEKKVTDDTIETIRYEHGGSTSHEEDFYNLLPGFLPSDMDLAEFAADVESLLGKGLDEDTSDIKGLLDCKEADDSNSNTVSPNVCFGSEKVKVEEEEMDAVLACQYDDPSLGDTLDWNFDYESPPLTGAEEEEEEKTRAAVAPEMPMMMMMVDSSCSEVEMRRKISLKLNHEAVINAWASQGCPWMTGFRPEFNPDDCWPDFLGMCGKNVHNPYGDTVGGCDRGREARVSRYREKRRTRLFSKKIRYEVRKLNAEKRPRMKGRFVKRTSSTFGGSVFPYLHK